MAHAFVTGGASGIGAANAFSSVVLPVPVPPAINTF